MQDQGDIKFCIWRVCSLCHHVLDPNTIHQDTEAPLGSLKGFNFIPMVRALTL